MNSKIAKQVAEARGAVSVALEEFNHDLGEVLAKRMAQFHQETGLHITDVQVTITSLKSVGPRSVIIESLPLAVRATSNAFE